MNQLNVFGKELELCCSSPITGAYRDGYCNTGINDIGTHTVCAIVTNKFLEFSKSKGNDLTTANPYYNFEGLKDGDKWCLCVSRWIEAYEAGCAPNLLLEATNIKTLDYVSFDNLLEYKAWIKPSAFKHCLLSYIFKNFNPQREGFFINTYIFKFKIDEKSIFIICSFVSFVFAPKEWKP